MVRRRGVTTLRFETSYETMKLLIVIALTCVIGLAYGRPQDKYTSKWDNINVDEILESQRLLKSYTDCLMERGRCTPDGKALKETLPDALEHDCNKCTEKQKQGSDKIIRNLVNKHPDMWKELQSKFDPENKYTEKYRDKLEKAKQ